MQQALAYHHKMYAITQAVSKRQYVLRRKFIILTDQKSLKHINKQTIQTPEQQYYFYKLMGFDFENHYRPRKMNLVAYVISQAPMQCYLTISQANFWSIRTISIFKCYWS